MSGTENEIQIRVKIPPFYSFLARPMRYKSIHGGRGAARSWSVGRVLIAKASSQKLRILCAREFQSSIKESVHQLLTDQIIACGLSSFYTVTRDSIKSTCGSEFLFKGLRHNPLEIKSLEGIDICWVEEAQSVSKESWDVLIPTIRKDNSEIWLSWNTGMETDATYQVFVVNKPPDCISVKATWRDNPYFPEVLERERLHCLAVDPDAHDHIWEGNLLKVSEAAIFRNKFEELEFDTPRDVKLHYGADWGFSNDPTVIIRSFILKDGEFDDLYIDYADGGVGIEINEIPQLFDSIPGSRDHEIKADSARPETISYVANEGFPVVSCKKWNGSVQDGVSHLKAFRKIYIHPRCNRDVITEFQHYSYKKDRSSGNILPVIVDAFNHYIDALRYSLEDRITSTEIDWLKVVA